ncbi:TPA: molybdopterin oxidoreductase family protein [Klebsiella michiganensis]
MKKITSVCPYCGAGCKLKLVVENNKILRAEAADGVTNQNQLCLKGYYGWDFLNDTQLLTPRLQQPMIRYQKGGKFTPVSWEEAIRYTANKLREIKEKHGPRAIMTTGSSRGTGNETNYVMQKFARGVLHTNNVDCCARVCHGPSVAGLQLALGNGAMSNSISDIENSKCLLVFGYNCADSHPIVARRVIKARENGAKIIVCDPRRIETARIADRHLQLNNGSNMALVNAFAHVLLEEDLYNHDYVDRFTEGLDAYRETVKDYSPEAVEGIVGVPAAEIRQAMRMFAAAPSATIMWGMGVTQFGQAVDVVRGLASEMGYPMHYDNNQQIWDEMRELCPLFYGVTYEKMGDMNHVQWPCPTLDHPGTPWLYKDNLFDTPTGKGQLFAAPWRAPAETPDEAYPLVLCTVREVGHYSCRSMTGNCAALQSLADEPGRVQINRADAQRLGIADQQLVWVSSRRGKVITRADISDRINEGAVYMTYQWWVGACNELTQDNLDPISKTPETKYCAVKVEAIADQRWAEQYAWTSYSEMKARLKAAVNV